MTDATKNGILAAAIFAGLLSLPTTWITIRSTNIQLTPSIRGRAFTPNTDFSDAYIPNISKTNLDVTGLNGYVTLLVKFPIWLIASLSIATCIFLIAESSDSFSFPRALLRCMAAAALALTVLPLVIAVGSGRATPGIGWALGLACAAAPILVLWATRNARVQEPRADDGG